MKVRYRKKLVLNNSLETGVVFYGLHMSEGIAHYKPHDEEPFTVFVGNQTIKLMNSTFQGKPVYVGHVDEHTKLTDADGVVSDSFYNKADGKHWCKFVITTQKGLDAIARGWKLSNSLVVSKHSQGGVHHGLDFDRTVDEGSFHHLAIVPNPRYEESDVLTSEQFKQYNNNKEAELIRLSNSKENVMKIRQLFKKVKVDNAKEQINLAEIVVVLEKTKREVTLEQLCNEADEEKPAPKEGEAKEASENDTFDLDGKKMTLKEFVKMFKDLKAEFDSLEVVAEEIEGGEGAADADEQLNNSQDEEDDDLDESGDLDEDDLDAHDAEVAAEEEAEAAKAKLDNAKEKPKAAAAPVVKKVNFAKKINNAAEVAAAKAAAVPKHIVDIGSDQVARGAQRYGAKEKK